MNADVKFVGTPLKKFPPATEDEMQKLVLGAANKSCYLDPSPKWLLKQCIEVLLPLITAIINCSLSESVVPSCFKRSNIAPLLKKARFGQRIAKKLPPSIKSSVHIQDPGEGCEGSTTTKSRYTLVALTPFNLLTISTILRTLPCLTEGA